MKYNKETDKISLDTAELVSTARRMLSKIPTPDCDEPSLREASERALKLAGVGRVTKTPFSHEFEVDEYAFTLEGEFGISEGALISCFSIDGNPMRPKREAAAEARGEAFIEAYLYARSSNAVSVEIRLIYINPADGRFSMQSECVNYSKLEEFFEKCKRVLTLYAKPEIERVTKRLPSLAHLKFPYSERREGQDDFISAVYRAIARGTRLYAAAPTGTGKTVSALYPALVALGRGKCDKIFYFTPKTTTAIAARECIDLCTKSGADVRAITLGAKERLCRSGLLCREDRSLCKRNSSNKTAAATLALYNAKIAVVGEEEIERFAKEYTVCPHELALSYSELADVVIGDVNYLFSPEAYIRRFFDGYGNYAFLIDEAHNLPDRAREMYSAELHEDEISAPSRDTVLGEESSIRAYSAALSKRFRDTLYPFVKNELTKDESGSTVGAAHIGEVPAALYEPIEAMAEELENELHAAYISRDGDKAAKIKYLNDYKRRITKFLSVMYAFDHRYEMFIFYENDKIRTKLYCIDPEARIAERLSHGRSAVFFSGTFSPLHYYRSTLGGDGSSDTLEIDSPFDRGQVSVSIMDKVSTRYSEREDSLLAVSKIIAATVSARRGNYMIFTPSFAYAEALCKVFSSKYPKIRVMLQRKNMTSAERADFLAAFSKDDKSYLIAFCVMGGIYSEGIDLAGDSLIGAVIVGIGLPSLSYEREAIAAYYQEKYEEGREFAYIYPGIGRVLQAAGRVIRREDDKGAIVLIDDRFDDPIYKKLIPKLWQGMKFISTAQELRSELDKFWQGEKSKRI